ncbi:MAG: hypothetical protein IIY45_10715 [Firmicutes bacterium]|nr:hypothetical protein [Bacillota bacterium]
MTKIIALIMALVLCLGGCSFNSSKEEPKEVEKIDGVVNLAKAIYPEESPYPSPDQYSDEKFDEAYEQWSDQRKAKRELSENLGSMDVYYENALTSLLLAGEEGENIAVSPLNIYLALSLLAESTDGETREQILTVLGRSDIKDVRTQAKALWGANYYDDGCTTNILANSVWLDENFSAKKDWLDELVNDYYASAYSGKTGSPEMNKALQTWLDEQTGGRLKEAAHGVELSPETLFALASTIYFKGSWDDEFNKNMTDDQVFHGTDGDENIRMMHQTDIDDYFYGENFSSVQKSMHDVKMVFILPDEGISPEQLMEDPEALDYMIRGEAETKYLVVHASVPKFDLTSNLMLNSVFQQMGITDVFSQKADFSPVSEEKVFLDSVQHAARVTVDEEGVVAAAFTVMMAEGAALPPDEEVDFVLDRPFIFLLKSRDGQILFAGIVNQIS